jgi:tetratricopeptide (TPR) repeat protein
MSPGLMAQAYPPDGYSPLLFDPGDTKADTKYVFRLSGAPWICRGDTFCKPIKIDGVADKDVGLAIIEPLGHAGARYFLAYKQANFEKGKEVVLSCSEERCAKLDATIGDATWLGNFDVKQGDRTTSRSAILRRLEARNGRAQILWCTDNDCSELPVTRDSESYFSFMGSGHSDGRTVAWLRDKSGAVLSCAQAEEGVSDQIACEKTPLVLRDFPAAPAVAAAPPPAPAPAPATPAPTASDAERNALAASIDRAIAAGDFATADRLMADATRRFAGYSVWPPLQQKLAKARADRDAQVRQAEARRLIGEARRFAQAGDFSHAEAMLQEADRQLPGFAETAAARAEIANLRTARGERYRDRQQFEAAIDQALATNRLFEAERLLADYAQRYGQDPDYRARASRLAELRGAAPNQARITEARAHIASARQAMARNDFGEADRQLDLADRAAPGFAEIAQARADLARRIAEVRRNPPTQTGNLPPPPPGPRSQ